MSQSVSAIDEIRALVAKHGLEPQLNAGGAAFRHPRYGHCQISAEDDEEDLGVLRVWLREKGLES